MVKLNFGKVITLKKNNGINENFSVGDIEVDAPPLHPFCRCSMSTVVDKEKYGDALDDVEGEEEIELMAKSFENISSKLPNFNNETIEYHLKFDDVLLKENINLVGANKPEFYILTSGLSGVFKSATSECEGLRQFIPAGTYYKREVAAYKLSQHFKLNLVPPTVARIINGQIGSFQLYIEDSKIYKLHKFQKCNELVKLATEGEKKLVLETEYKKLLFFDYLIWNTDRREMNCLIKNNKLVAIDNGLSFPAVSRKKDFVSDNFILQNKLVKDFSLENYMLEILYKINIDELSFLMIILNRNEILEIVNRAKKLLQRNELYI